MLTKQLFFREHYLPKRECCCVQIAGPVFGYLGQEVCYRYCVECAHLLRHEFNAHAQCRTYKMWAFLSSVFASHHINAITNLILTLTYAWKATGKMWTCVCSKW